MAAQKIYVEKSTKIMYNMPAGKKGQNTKCGKRESYGEGEENQKEKKQKHGGAETVPQGKAVVDGDHFYHSGGAFHTVQYGNLCAVFQADRMGEDGVSDTVCCVVHRGVCDSVLA